MYIYRRLFVYALAFLFNTGIKTGHAIKIIARVFTLTIDQQVFFFKHQVLAVVFGHFKIGYQLYGVGWTCIFAIPAKNTSGGVDAKEIGIPEPTLIFGSLQGNTIYRTSHCT